MTDQHEPDRPRPPGQPAAAPDGGMPVAGRKPRAPGEPVADGPTVPLKRPKRTPPPTPAEEPTAVSPAAVPDEDPTVVTPQQHVDQVPAADHEPEADSRAAAGQGSEADDEATTLLTPAPAAEPLENKQVPAGTAGTAPDDEPAVTEPAVEQAKRPELDGETQRLRLPEVLPGPAVDEKRGVPAASPDPVNAGADAAPEPSVASSRVPESETAASETQAAGRQPAQPPSKRLSSAGALIWVLLALFGFTLVVQLRSNDTDVGLASARQEDLVRILSDLEAQDTRLQAEITGLENSQRQLTSGVLGRQAALAEAEKRADELGLLAGTMPGRGPGLRIVVGGVKASAILNAVQELRGAGGEVMQLAGTTGGAVRIVASTYFVDAEGGGIVVDGSRLTGPWTLSVIGPPQTMETALRIPGGVVASVNGDGGSVTMNQREAVEVAATREASSLQYARPVS